MSKKPVNISKIEKPVAEIDIKKQRKMIVLSFIGLILATLIMFCVTEGLKYQNTGYFNFDSHTFSTVMVLFSQICAFLISLKIFSWADNK